MQYAIHLFKQDDNWGVTAILEMGTEGIKPAVASAAKEGASRSGNEIKCHEPLASIVPTYCLCFN